MEPDQQIEKSKQPYQKPKLRTIELAAEEVLAVGCKTVAIPAPLGATCIANTCSTLGS